MNVLVVDDDCFVVTLLKEKVNWEGLEIEQVYTARNIRQAKNIFKKQNIHLLISDIEMPLGSGLELLAWVRQEGYTIQTIFLTNFADFHYAQKAIELQSFEYYLKPIEIDKLEFSILKAIKKVKANQQSQQAIQVGQYWQQNKQKLVDHFWSTYLRNHEWLQADLEEQLLKNHLNYSTEDYFLPILLNIFPYHISFKENSTPIFEIDKTSVSKLIIHLNSTFKEHSFALESIVALDINKESYVLLLRQSDEQTSFVSLCENLIHTLREKLSIDSRFSIGFPAPLVKIQAEVKQLQKKCEDMIEFRNSVQHFLSYELTVTSYTEPNLAVLEKYLQNGNKQSFLAKCRQYLIHLKESNALNLNVLSNFRLDITQLLFTHLKKKEVLAHKLFNGYTNNFLQTQSLRSIDDMIIYITYLVDISLQYIDFIHSQKNVVNTICDYIDEHYHENITRDNIAKIVYLSPDYITRIFKKEKGLSLVNYIIKKRVDIAKELLIQTTLPVHIISDKVGYGNYSYFTKLFKKETNYTPFEYRRKEKSSAL
ncbi:response regulator [Bacillus circulans]|nr:response regulator [Niallia circulans]NRG28254.1 response regulator [Niallia circulans]